MSVNFQETLEDAFKEAGNKTVREALFKSRLYRVKYSLTLQRSGLSASKNITTLTIGNKLIFSDTETQRSGISWRILTTRRVMTKKADCRTLHI